MSNTDNTEREPPEEVMNTLEILWTQLCDLKEQTTEQDDMIENYRATITGAKLLMNGANRHISFIKSDSPVTQDIKNLMVAKITEFKLDLLEYQNECTFTVLQMQLKEMKEKLKASRLECKQLKTEVRSLKVRIVDSYDSKQEIKLKRPLAVKACLNGRRGNDAHIIFQGYTSYQELCQKIQNKFGVETFVIMAKNNGENGYSTEVATAADYREAVRRAVTAVETSDSIPLMDIDVQTDTDESGSELSFDKDVTDERLSEEESERALDMCDLDFPVVRMASDLRTNGETKNKHERYYPINLYLLLVKPFPRTTIYLEYVFMISDPKDPTKRVYQRGDNVEHVQGFDKNRRWHETVFRPVVNSEASDHWQIPFMENGNFIISVYVRMVKDPSTSNEC